VVNGGAGVVTVVDGRVVSVLATTVREGRIVAIDILADRDRLALFTPPA
jgi:RNA polymerase sigma-70 factor (ECF subfamily)